MTNQLVILVLIDNWWLFVLCAILLCDYCIESQVQIWRL